MTATEMRAIQLNRVGEDPRPVALDVPEPGPDEVRVAMRACGICGSDLHIIEGSTLAGFLPLTLGHEPAGVVDAVGPDVTDLVPGQRVVVSSMISCGRCPACVRGRSNVCHNLVLMGVDVHGAQSEYFVAPVRNCVPLPDSIAFAEGAVVTDSVATPLHAIRRSFVQPDELAVVFGAGGLGGHAIMLLKQIFGAHVIAVDTYDGALKRAGLLGADEVVDGREERVARKIAALSGGGVDVAFDFVGLVPVVEQCLRSLRRGGRCVAVGVTPERLALTVRQETLVARELGVCGSLGFVLEDVVEALRLIDSGELVLRGGISHRFPLEQYADGLAALRDHTSNPMRIVITNEAR